MPYLPDPVNSKPEWNPLLPVPIQSFAMDALPEPAPGLLDYFSIVWKRKHYLLGFLAAGIALSLAFTLSQKMRYRAYLQLEVQELNQNFMNVGQLDPSATSQAAAPDSYVQTQVQVLQSDELLERVIRRLRLDERPSYIAQSITPTQKIAQKLGVERFLAVLPNPRYAQIVREALELPPPGANTPMVRALWVASNNLKVKAAAQSTLVQLYYTAPDRESPSEFLNTLAEEFVSNTMEVRWAGTERTAKWLQSRLAALRANLETSERRLQNYAKSSGLLYTNDRESVGEEKLRQVQSELSKAQADVAIAQARYERSLSTQVEQLPEVRDDLLIKDYYTRLADLERDRSQLAATMTPGHYKVQKVDAEIAQVKTLIATQHRTIVSRIANENQAAGRRRALLEDAYQRQFKTVSEQAEQSVPIEILKREVESNRQFYQDMLQKVNSAGIATAIRASNIRVVNAARPPSTSYRPDLIQNEAVGLGASILLGLFTCFLSEGLERRNSKVQKPGDAPLFLGMRELGVIPAIKTLEAEPWRSESKNVKFLPRFTSLFYRGMISLGTGVRESKSTALTTWQGPSSLITDSFHSTLDTLLYSAGQAQTGQVFAITSALPLEGKTTIATNLAFAMAAIDMQVLLIDADLRRPRLHTQFKLRNGEGLATLLVSEGPVTDATIQPVTVGNRGGLWVLTAGESKVNFSSLLARSKLAEFLEYQKSQFDAILIDTPPALLFPEAKLLGRLADGVILVVRSNQNPISVYRETVGILQHSGSTVLGTILNNWQPTLAQKHYYRSYAKA